MSNQAGGLTRREAQVRPRGRVDRWDSGADLRQGFPKGEGDGCTLT